MNIVSLLHTENVIPNLEAEDKIEVLNKLVDSLQSQVGAEELEAIREAVLEREKIMSTGVGKGLAIPHGKAEGIDDNYAAFAILKDQIDYEAVDGQPVKLVFMLVGPQSSNSLHIKMLSKISRLMNNTDFRNRLTSCTTADEIIGVFEEEEKAHFGG
ncbi:PTS sugar transporter subunit IIA [Halalkalibaculum sp. DA3122]|uniref:PTS sugar transporter subunit IIA n=1 Tax=unclassified Halalkalibaculum TaxID=2964617 RepID=UPI0037551A44